MIFQLVYVSYARNELSTVDLEDIAKRASMKNKDLDITGILLFSEGNILQILEGDEQAIEALYAKIAQDDRHGGVIVMLRKHTNAREFGNWSMGFRAVSKAAYNDAVFILTKNSLEDSLPENRSPEIDIMVRSFARANAF